jgi:DNA-binding GntR family transcriptional regulator
MNTVIRKRIRMVATSLTQKAYEHVQAGIFNGRLRAGSVISEAALAKELGISRTPVGEAIRQLAGEGLVEQVPRYGTIVRPIDRRELLELYEMREALESYAAARAAEHMSQETLARLKQFCDVMEAFVEELRSGTTSELDEAALRKFLAADMAFHLLIIEASGNRRMIQVVKNMRTLSRVFRMKRLRHDLRVVQRAAGYHRKIYDALRSGDSQASQLLMAEHIGASKRDALARLDREADTGSDVLRELPADVLKELDLIEQPTGAAAIATVNGDGDDEGAY